MAEVAGYGEVFGLPKCSVEDFELRLEGDTVMEGSYRTLVVVARTKPI